MRASLAMLCLTVALLFASAVEAQWRPVGYEGGRIKFLGVSGSLWDSDAIGADPSEGASPGWSGSDVFSNVPAIPSSLSLAGSRRPKVQLLPEMRVSNPCSGIDTAIMLRNNLQDTLTLTTVKLTETDHFSVESKSLPLMLVPGEALSVRIHAAGKASGTYSSSLLLGLKWGELAIDTMVALSLTVERDLPFVPGIASRSNHIGPISACETTTFPVALTNPLCDTIKLTSARWFSPTNSFSMLDDGSKAISIAPGATLNRMMRFAPSIAGELSGRLLLTFRYGARVFDTTLTFMGTANSNYLTFLSDNVLAFDSVLHCDARQKTTYFHNASCDSVLVEFVEGTPIAGYSVAEPRQPVWVAKGDSIPVTILLSPTRSGAIHDYVELDVRTRQGEEHQVELRMTGFVVAPKHEAEFPGAFVLDSVKPCATIDTVLRIVNRGICDTIKIRSIELKGSDWFFLDPKTPMRTDLLPGETLRIPIKIAVDPEGSAKAELRMSGVGFDSTIAMSVSARSGGIALELVATQTVLTATLCQSATVAYFLHNPGCIDIPVDTFMITSDEPSQTQFRITSELPKPLIIKAGDSLPVYITFDADGNGDGEAYLLVRSAKGRYSKTVSLIGNVSGHKGGARIGLLAGKGEQQATSTAGQIVSISVVALDDVPDSLTVTGLSYALRFDDGVLTHRTLDGVNGWSVAYASDSNGQMRMYMSHKPGLHIRAGNEIAKLSFYTTISDSNFSHLTLEQPRFNPEDPGFERCSLSALSADDTLRIDISMFTGTSDGSDHGMQGDHPTIRGMAVYPNPITSRPGKIAMAEVDFTLAEEGPVRVDLRDNVGRLVAVFLQAPMSAGKHYVPIALPLSGEGNYFLTIESGGFRDVRKVIIRN